GEAAHAARRMLAEARSRRVGRGAYPALAAARLLDKPLEDLENGRSPTLRAAEPGPGAVLSVWWGKVTGRF
ncbi:MAG: hypothetical protein HQL35_14395, partial [Alphaproteobacteria bacterium]|nr:hypothetical protein [Alphaproteobacteria bacterium]